MPRLPVLSKNIPVIPGKSGLDLEDEDVEHDLNGTNMGLISKF